MERSFKSTAKLRFICSVTSCIERHKNACVFSTLIAQFFNHILTVLNTNSYSEPIEDLMLVVLQYVQCLMCLQFKREVYR